MKKNTAEARVVTDPDSIETQEIPPQENQDNVVTVEFGPSDAADTLELDPQEALERNFNHAVDEAAEKLGLTGKDKKEWLDNVQEARAWIIKIAEKYPDPVKKMDDLLADPESLKIIKEQKAEAEAPTRLQAAETQYFQQISLDLNVSQQRIATLYHQFGKFGSGLGFIWQDFMEASARPEKPSGLWGRLKGVFKKPESPKMKMYKKMVKAFNKLRD